VKRAVFLLAALIATPATAQTTPAEAVGRFVAAVQAGSDLKTGEFAAIVTPEDAAKLATIAKCIPGQPRTSETGSSIMVLWDCVDVPGASSTGTMFDVRDGKLTGLFLMPATVVRVRPAQ
jgi:hypothetical protein